MSARLPRAASIVARIGLVLTVLGALTLVLSAVGSRWDWWDFRTGFVIFRWTLYGGLVAVDLGTNARRIRGFLEALRVARPGEAR